MATSVHSVLTGDTHTDELSLELFPNHGSGGTKLKGDGAFYCDMFGRGRDGMYPATRYVRCRAETYSIGRLSLGLIDWRDHLVREHSITARLGPTRSDNRR